MEDVMREYEEQPKPRKTKKSVPKHQLPSDKIATKEFFLLKQYIQDEEALLQEVEVGSLKALDPSL